MYASLELLRVSNHRDTPYGTRDHTQSSRATTLDCPLNKWNTSNHNHRTSQEPANPSATWAEAAAAQEAAAREAAAREAAAQAAPAAAAAQAAGRWSVRSFVGCEREAFTNEKNLTSIL